MKMAGLEPQHFLWELDDQVAVIRLNRPRRKNALTFDSYRELRDTFADIARADDVRAVVLASNGGEFCSGGDVNEIIGPLLERDMKGLLEFTRMTGELARNIIQCRVPVIAAIDGTCVGAGAMLALASDLRLATPRARTAFLFTRVGLSGCDMGACTLLPRVVGQGRAAELLFTGRALSAEEGLAWGFYNRLVEEDGLLDEALALARDLARGPAFAHQMTKTMLEQEWAVSVSTAIEMEAQGQAICMQSRDFRRAYEAFSGREAPRFEGD